MFRGIIPSLQQVVGLIEQPSILRNTALPEMKRAINKLLYISLTQHCQQHSIGQNGHLLAKPVDDEALPGGPLIHLLL
jgi:hypothetical protein